MGVDVASFGDFFAEKRRLSGKRIAQPIQSSESKAADAPSKPRDASSPKKRHGGAAAAAEGPIETMSYRDPFAGVYKKYIFSADGKYLIGGMMVGDTSDYIKLVAIVKKKVI